MVNPFGSNLVQFKKPQFINSPETNGTLANNRKNTNDNQQQIFSNFNNSKFNNDKFNPNILNPQKTKEPNGIQKLVSLFSANSDKLNLQKIEEEQTKVQMYQNIIDNPNRKQTGRKLNYII